MHTRRRILYVGGYDPVTPNEFFSRQDRELRRFEETWSVTVRATEAMASTDGAVWQRRLATTAPDGWTTETDFRLLAWDDVIQQDFARPIWQRIPLSIGALADFLLSGTIARYYLHAWRFAMYFLMPYLAMLLFVAASAIAASLILALDPPGAGIAATLAAVAIFVILMRWPGRHWFVPHLLDAQTFVGQYLHGERRDMTERLDRFARELIDATLADIDELVLVGHSIGGIFALECAERALSIDPACARRRISISIVTVGSCVLQIGLHGAARKSFVPHLIRLRDEPTIDWVDFQALSDLVNFYKTNPAALMGLGSREKGDFPRVHILRIRDMLTTESYRRMRKSLFRLHYQFVSANTQRYWYDFYMICCGPHHIAQAFMWPEP